MKDDRLKDKTSINIIYIIGAILIAKLFHSIFKSNNVNNEQILHESNSEEDKTDFKPTIEKPKELGKNTFLHTTDNFGIMKRGKVK